MAILVTKDGEQYGPYELIDLKSYVSQGSFSLSDMCWQEGWAKWQPLSNIISRPPPPPQNNAVVQNTRQEETVFSDASITITTTRISIRGTTYALRNITSVKMAMTPAKQGCAIVLMIFGIFMVLGALGTFSSDAGTGFICLLISGAIVAAAIFWLRSCKADYHVAIASASGEAHALTSKDKTYITKVVSSINDAIVRYQ